MSLETFPYGNHDLQTVTVAKPYPARAPLHAENTDNESGYWVILIHGGAWRDPTQTSTSYLTPALRLLSSSESLESQSQHITGLASISYRLSAHPSHPQDPSTIESHLRNARHPEHIDDVQLALSFLQRKYKFGERYVLVGHSCGATLAFQAVMRSLSTQPGMGSGDGYVPPLAILGMAGIYDLRLLRDSHQEISAYQEFTEGAFGADENVWDAVSPRVVMGEEGVEGWKEGRVVVLAHSDEDELCDVAQSEKMKEFLGVWEKKSERREVRFLPIKGKHNEAWEKGEGLARGILFTIEKLQELGI
ncbi:arylformamidase [Aspergillus mulundensis]|uniref:Kynurenine formamidase n=1 Tax=Aspergillus mulundensis TaxID=1810919 RepID=A0A3D8RQK2_9EURO|nr:Kynurenine formamidase [Aspergillus mulundensis]RDW76367.1 Kynurenine formamidase [Aspergillus mulundensis]